MDQLKYTPICEEHKKLGALMAPFGGWLMPIQYSRIIEEHNWTRSSASLFDICHMGEFLIDGDCQKSNLDRIVTSNIKDIPAGKCRYGMMLDEKGGIIDDLVVYRLQQDKWMLVVNAATTSTDEAHLRKHLSKDAVLENISSKVGKLDLQGPLSREVLTGYFGPGINALQYYGFSYFNILGERNIISRSGYTGELGFELYLSNEKILELWNHILRNKKVKPGGLGARDTLRLEMGYSLYGHDIDQSVTPLEAGLEKFVDLKKDFIGKDVLMIQSRRAAKKRLIGFKTKSRRAPRAGYKIFSLGQEIGWVTSGSFSPSLECGIGLGYINSDGKAINDIVLKEGKIEIEAAIAEKPFCRNTSLRV